MEKQRGTLRLPEVEASLEASLERLRKEREAMKKCRGCGVGLVWLTAEDGQKIPVEAANGLHNQEPFDPEEHVDHLATCSKLAARDAHAKSSKGPRPQKSRKKTKPKASLFRSPAILALALVAAIVLGGCFHSTAPEDAGRSRTDQGPRDGDGPDRER